MSSFTALLSRFMSAAAAGGASSAAPVVMTAETLSGRVLNSLRSQITFVALAKKNGALSELLMRELPGYDQRPLKEPVTDVAAVERLRQGLLRPSTSTTNTSAAASAAAAPVRTTNQQQQQQQQVRVQAQAQAQAQGQRRAVDEAESVIAPASLCVSMAIVPAKQIAEYTAASEAQAGLEPLLSPAQTRARARAAKALAEDAEGEPRRARAARARSADATRRASSEASMEVLVDDRIVHMTGVAELDGGSLLVGFARKLQTRGRSVFPATVARDTSSSS